MNDATLARLEHGNFLAALGSLATQVEGHVVRQGDGVTAVLTGSPIRLFNHILVEGSDPITEIVAAQLADAVALARERGDRFLVSLRAGTDDRLVPRMAELGLVSIAEGPFMPGMAMRLRDGALGDDRPEAADQEIRVVDDVAGIRDHVVAVAAGFGFPEEIAGQVVTQALLGRPGIRVYVGYVDGRPVTTGLGFRTGSTMGVYNIATVPSHRRRGYGEAMTRRILGDGVADGCTVAILQSSDMGRPIYERLGFRSVVEYVAYADPPGADEPDGT
jgi:ribosomal protein S18 acetylase RimI-like enzyme